MMQLFVFLLLWRSWVYLVSSQDTKAPVPVCAYPHSVTAVSHAMGNKTNPGEKLAEGRAEHYQVPLPPLVRKWLSWQPKDIRRHNKSSGCNAVLTDSGINCALLPLMDWESQSSKKLNAHPSPFCFQNNLILWFFYCTTSNLHTVHWTQGSESITETSADSQCNLNLIKFCLS